jgi:HSP20 family molecular chaperone IbpA
MLRRFWDDLADPVRRLEDPPSTEIYTENGDLIVRFELAGVDPQKDVTLMVGAAKAMETDGEKARLIPISTSTESNKVEASA